MRWFPHDPTWGGEFRPWLRAGSHLERAHSPTRLKLYPSRNITMPGTIGNGGYCFKTLACWTSAIMLPQWLRRLETQDRGSSAPSATMSTAHNDEATTARQGDIGQISAGS